jgi:signal transduction histidine kinase
MALVDRISAMTLNEAALTDAASVRDEVVRLLRELPNEERSSFIQDLAAGAESRLRQIVARAAQLVEVDDVIAPIMERWLLTETDEFTRAAIEDALAPRSPRRKTKRLLGDLEAVPRTYRYLADRLRHRVLNIMPGAGLSVTKLKEVAAAVEDEQQRYALTKEIDYLSSALARLERALDFVEEKAHFDLANIDLGDWLHDFERSYRAEWPELEMRLVIPDVPVNIEAIPYLLKTVFANLLDNARQAIASGGFVTITLRLRAREVNVKVSDSGRGLPDRVADIAFLAATTTKGQTRGRGLLEVADAMKRLGGNAVVARGAEGNRVSLTFPVRR